MIDMSGTRIQEQHRHPHATVTVSYSKKNLSLHQSHHSRGGLAESGVTNDTQAKSAVQITSGENTYQSLTLPKPFNNNLIEYQSLTQLAQPQDLPPPIGVPPKSEGHSVKL